MDELIARDICDNDLYKFTMGQLVLRRFDRAIAKYRYINRAANKTYRKGFADRVMEQVRGMSELSLTHNMYQFFKDNCPWMRESYLQWFRGYRFNPDQVSVTQDESGHLHIEVVGPWFETIYWEVPLLYIVTQLSRTNDTGSLYPMMGHWKDLIHDKAEKLFAAGVNVMDFGTRRRAAYIVQDQVCETFKRYVPTPQRPNGFRGTSNPYLAMKHKLVARGTTAHELTMALQAKVGLQQCNKATMDAWIEEYDGDLGIALTDTITTVVFLRDFDKKYARLYDGVRPDSGDPKIIGDLCIEHYKRLGIDPMSKMLVLSDKLDTDSAIELHQYFLNRIKTLMGIGTHLSNDVGWEASNHVIKLVEIDFGHGMTPVLKLSDDMGKQTGEDRYIEDAKRILGI